MILAISGISQVSAQGLKAWSIGRGIMKNEFEILTEANEFANILFPLIFTTHPKSTHNHTKIEMIIVTLSFKKVQTIGWFGASGSWAEPYFACPTLRYGGFTYPPGILSAFFKREIKENRILGSIRSSWIAK